MKCMYCGKEIKEMESHNPEDFGLHTPYLNFKDKRTCSKCNSLITITNRLLKGVLDNNGSENSLTSLEIHMEEIKNLYK